MLLDATQKFAERLTADRLLSWHVVLFPTGRIGMSEANFGGQIFLMMQLKTPSVGPAQTASAVHSEDAHAQVTVPPHAAGIVTQL
jgi:hypothetical protein